MKITTFDIGVNMGWASGSTDGAGKLACGCKRLGPTGSSHQNYAKTCLTFLTDILDLERPDEVWYEFSQGVIAGKQGAGHTSIDVILIHAGVRFAIMGVAGLYDIRCVESSPQAHVKSFLRGAKVPKGEAKKMVKRECFIRGIEVPNDHAADAVSLWHHAAFTRDPDFAARDAVARMRMRDPAGARV
jgi:hypothetical protein